MPRLAHGRQTRTICYRPRATPARVQCTDAARAADRQECQRSLSEVS